MCDGTPCPCNLVEPHAGLDGVPWAGAFNLGRCRARLEPGARGAGPFHGRCELRRHRGDVDHALERGMDTVRWASVVRGAGGFPTLDDVEAP